MEHAEKAKQMPLLPYPPAPHPHGSANDMGYISSALKIGVLE